MTRWAAIEYRDFWDVPRIFFLTDGGRTYLFDCSFDDEVEDFPEEYRVYLMSKLSADERAGSWDGMESKAVAELGRIAIADVKFDPTKRQFVDSSILDTLAATSARASG